MAQPSNAEAPTEVTAAGMISVPPFTALLNALVPIVFTPLPSVREVILVLANAELPIEPTLSGMTRFPVSEEQPLNALMPIWVRFSPSVTPVIFVLPSKQLSFRRLTEAGKVTEVLSVVFPAKASLPIVLTEFPRMIFVNWV